MSKHRLRFTKDGLAIYISHLDLMRSFQRAFLRAGLTIKHTEGYNPHAYISVVLPLSVGVSSQCELLDFELKTEGVALDQLPELLNATLPSGVVVQQAYEGGRKVAQVKYLQCRTVLEYDSGIPTGCAAALAELFSREELVIIRRTKKGEGPGDIKPGIKQVDIREEEGKVIIESILSAQNPSMSPERLTDAIRQLMPELTPDFAYSHRIETFDENMEVYR